MRACELPATGPALSTHRGIRRTLQLIAIAAFSSTLSMRVADPMLPSLARSFGGAPTDMAAIITAFNLAYALLILAYGPLGDRLGKLRIITGASFFAALGSIGCALALSLPMLTALRFVTGAACAGLIPLSLAWIGDRVELAERQQTLAHFAVATIGGGMTGQVVGGLFADTLGWRWAFVAPALLFLIAGVMLQRTRVVSKALASSPQPQPQPQPTWQPGARPGSVLYNYARLLGDPWVRYIMLIVGIEGAFFFGAVAFVPSYLHEHLALPLWHIGLLVGTFSIGGLLFSGFSRLIIGRLALAGCARLGGFAIACGIAVVVLGGHWSVAIIGGSLAGFGISMLHNTLQTQATQMWPAGRGMALAGFVAALFGGQALGVALSAQLVGAIGYQPTLLGFALVMGLVGLAYGSRLASRERRTGER